MENALRRSTYYKLAQIEEKARAFQKKVIEMASQNLEQGNNIMSPKKISDNVDRLLDLISRLEHEFVPLESITAIMSQVGQTGFVLTTSAGEKLKNIANL